MKQSQESQSVQQNRLQKQRQEAILYLSELSKKSPIGHYLLNCILCGKDSQGKSRCKKHQQKYNDYFYETNQDFLASFKDQF